MKYSTTLLLFVIAVFSFGQSTINPKQLINKWIQGKIDSDGTVVQADINRGGWYYLDIHSDTSVVFGDPFTCGFGYERFGKWTFNKTDTTVTFFFRKKARYLHNPDTVNINEKKIYKIEKIISSELILKQTDNVNETIFPFIKAKEQ